MHGRNTIVVAAAVAVLSTTSIARAQCFTLTSNSTPPGAGNITINTQPNCPGGFLANTQINISVNPPIGFVLGSWSASGGSFADPNTSPATFTITSNATVTAALLQQWYNAGSTIYTLSNMGVGGQGGTYPFRIVKAGTDWSLPNLRASGYFAPPDEHSGVWIGYNTVENVGVVGAIGVGGALTFWTNNGFTWAERARITPNGDFSVTGNLAAKYQDIAEWVNVTEQSKAGTVVVLDPAVSDHVVPSRKPYDTGVAGVITERPGLKLGEPAADRQLVATAGRVRVHVDASQQAINIGDLLVTGSKAGTAMKSVALDINGVEIHRPGTILGKALEPLPRGEGDILVLLTLQ